MTPVDPDDDDDDVDVDALERRFEAALARSRELPQALSPDELATLALPPFWTDPALHEVFDQPGEAEAVLAKAGPFLHVEGNAGRRSIWVREPNAPALVAKLRDHRDLGRWAAVGAKIARVAELPPVLSAWAGLVRQLGDRSDYDLSRELLARVAAVCEAGQPGAVQDLVEGAASLARGLGPPLSGAVRVAQHRIQRWYTVQRDRRKLLHFVLRRDALAALDHLLDDRDPAAPWALHYVGAAGMGKTSLIRHLMTEIAGRRGLQVARIDFDHLSPAYPAHEPGQLIASLAYELTALIETESQDKLIGFVESALEQLRDLAGLGGADLRALLDSREMQELMAWFGSLLQSFARPVLVLDTCEELTKLEVTNGTIPSVEATFVMLERLHAQAPQLRVVLAGRRLLAGTYANWAASDEVARRAGVTASRPFMTLHELRGFDAAEARSYLGKRLPAARRTDEPLIDKLLALSPEPMRVSALAAAPDPAPHYNPFDLARYAEWVEADPGVQLAAFDEADIDPYVEVRIVQRMGELEPLLPAIVLLRRFDLAMLAPALPAGGSPQAIFDKLGRHEWLRATHLGGRTVLEVDRGLPARIERCIAASRSLELARARTQLGAALRRMVEAGSLMEISVEVYDAALRILPPEDAAALWRDIEARIGSQADWRWSAQLTRDLIAEGYAGEHADNLVGLAIRATHTSAIVHAGAGADLDALWREIDHGAASIEARDAASVSSAARGAHHGKSPVWLLRQRARLGHVAASAAAGGAGDQAALVAAITAIIEELARGGEPRALASSRCAAIEAVVELAERDPARAAPEFAALVEHLAFDQPALAAFGGMLRARIEALVSRDARTSFAIPDPVPELPATVLDWRPPASLQDRLRLEVVRQFELLDLSTDPADRSALRDAAETWQSWADQATATIDGDRLRAAVITVLGSGVRTSATSAVDAATEARCAAHRQFPPLAFVHGRVALARGEPSAARAIVRQLPRPWAQRLSCEIARWTRQPDDLLEEMFIDGLDAETNAAIDAARAIVKGAASQPAPSWPVSPTGPAPNTSAPLERLHPSLRGEALRVCLRGLALSGGNLGIASSEREVMTAIEEAELLDLSLPEAALRLFEWASDGAAQQALAPARLRATFGAWLAARHAADEPAALRAGSALDGQLVAKLLELTAYRPEIERAKLALLRPRPGVFSKGISAVVMQHPGSVMPPPPPSPVAMANPSPAAASGADQPFGRPGLPPRAPSGGSIAGPPGAAPLPPVGFPPPQGSPSPIPGGPNKTVLLQPSEDVVSVAHMEHVTAQSAVDPPAPPAHRFQPWGGAVVAAGVVAMIIWLLHAVLPISLLAVLAGTGLVAAGSAMAWRWKSARYASPLAPLPEISVPKPAVLSPQPSPPVFVMERDVPTTPAITSRPEPRTVIVVTERSPGIAEIAIETRPATGEAVRGIASIEARGEWPTLISEDFRPALVALAGAAGRDSIALDPSPALAPRCWEGTLYDLVPSAMSRLAFHRVLPESRMQHADLKPAQIEADGSLKDLLVRAWKGKPGIVHVVRRFIRTKQGDVQLTADYGRDISGSSPQTMPHVELAEARLLIVQCDPSTADTSTRANTSESELAREYALGALRRVSACGLVIPAIPARLLAEFTARLAAGAGDCTRAELIELARDLRTYLHEHGCPMCDLTLFLREGHLN